MLMLTGSTEHEEDPVGAAECRSLSPTDVRWDQLPAVHAGHTDERED